MDDSEAIRIARQYCHERGTSTRDYEVLSVRGADGMIHVLFQGRSGQPGDHFSVYLDASTGEAVKLVPGR